jgi:hypothetical protein
LVALLATPFLLLMMAAAVSWLKVSGKLPVHRQMMFASVLHKESRPSDPGRKLPGPAAIASSTGASP